MRIIAKSNLRDYWTSHPDAEAPLRTWIAVTEDASWEKPLDVMEQYPQGSAVGNGRFVFRFDGHRLVTWIAYDYYCVYIKWIGRHDEYNDIDPKTVDDF